VLFAVTDIVLEVIALFLRAPWKGGAYPVGESPTRQRSLQPEAIGAVMEATKWLKPLV
jgi:hypothetical protein